MNNTNKNARLKALLLDGNALGRSLTRISHEIIEHNETCDNLCIIGIKTRGVPIAKRIAQNIKKNEGIDIPLGTIDVTLYRDDLSFLNNGEVKVDASSIDLEITGKNVILTDDVIYTGRTARAAMEAIIQAGRPATIQLAVMVDRGHRELPIRPDYVGKNVPTSKHELIKVNLSEIDGVDNVELYEAKQ